MNRVLNASTCTTKGHAMFSLNTKLGTGMILLKNKVKSCFTIFETLPPSCKDPCEMTITQ